jgi:hypothetical protein
LTGCGWFMTASLRSSAPRVPRMIAYETVGV